MGAKVKATGIKGGVTAGRAQVMAAKRIMAIAKKTTSVVTGTDSMVIMSNEEVTRRITALMATSPSTTRLQTGKDLAKGATANSTPITMATKTRRVGRTTVTTRVVTRDLVLKLHIKANPTTMMTSRPTMRTRVMAENMVDKLQLKIIHPSLVQPGRTTLTQSRAANPATTRRSTSSRKWLPHLLKLPWLQL